MLLSHQKGCQSFADIRTVSGQIFPTFRAACERLGLLGDNREWLYTFNEAATWATSSELRSLFTYLLQFCEISNPMEIWDTQWRKMADDIIQTHGLLNEEDIKQYVLYEIQLLLRSEANPSSLKNFGLPLPQENLLSSLANKLLMEEKNYDRLQLSSDHECYRRQLNSQQNAIYQLVIQTLTSNGQILLFVYGHGGTGKTFLWKTIISALRSQGKIVLAVAASGIASLLLPSGRTAHSRFKIPLNLADNSICHVKKNTHLAQLLKETSLIIWDEAPMNDRKCFESLDRTLKDILNNPNNLFGGKSLLLGGDFRQTLPIKPKAAKSTILASSLPRSYLWPHFKIHKLIENMRLQRPNLHPSYMAEVAAFSSWLLAVGDGLLGTSDADDPNDTKRIRIP
ncbi:putative DNA helicase [Helianthus debilis subsp. tardiflorus]